MLLIFFREPGEDEKTARALPNLQKMELIEADPVIDTIAATFLRPLGFPLVPGLNW